MTQAYEKLGTMVAVAAAFGVDRNVVRRWLRKYALNPESKPEVRHANFVREALKSEPDRIRVAQWVTDEGSVGVTYHPKTDTTVLLVCGEMNDYEAINSISSILRTPCDGIRSPQPTVLPLLGVRMISAKAYALLEILLPYMYGLKAMEARAALAFFPRYGTLKGRHTSDEFLTDVWREFALRSVSHWNEVRDEKLSAGEVQAFADAWVNGRIRRARRFLERSLRNTQFKQSRILLNARSPCDAGSLLPRSGP